ncbi:uncharacterized protein LOC135687627 [Rhopilema esculentum]|uniref:uncharacterized protein LOC135687627 n=1 Tax=Rhopilema esculentum TaxID=499914 RepID=UPI0031E0C55C
MGNMEKRPKEQRFLLHVTLKFGGRCIQQRWSFSDFNNVDLEMDKIIWAKFHRGIYWPGEVIEELVEGHKVEFVHLFDRNECRRMSKKVGIACWNCSEKANFINVGENLKMKQKCLSFKRAVEEAEKQHESSSSVKRSLNTACKLSTCKKSGHKRESGSEPYHLSDGNADLQYSNENSCESEGEDLPAAFTPIKKTPETMARGDVVWAKFKAEPYWPGVFHSIVKGKKPKVWVYFFDKNWNIEGMNRVILPINEKFVFPFCCDEDKKKTFLEEGTASDDNFMQYVKFAEEYLASKAAGKINDIFEYESQPDDESDNNSLEFPQSTSKRRKLEVVNITPTKSPTKFKDLVTGKSWRTGTSKEEQKQLLSAIKKTRPTLEKILHGEIECKRHTIFTKGTTKEKNMLKHSSGYGPIDDDKIAEKVLEKLLEWYNNSKKRRRFNSVTYVSEVWLPEAIIMALMDSRNIGRQKAEEIFNNSK